MTGMAFFFYLCKSYIAGCQWQLKWRKCQLTLLTMSEGLMQYSYCLLYLAIVLLAFVVLTNMGNWQYSNNAYAVGDMQAAVLQLGKPGATFLPDMKLSPYVGIFGMCVILALAEAIFLTEIDGKTEVNGVVLMFSTLKWFAILIWALIMLM